MTTLDRRIPQLTGAEQARATLTDGEIHVRFPYDPDLVARMRGVPGRRWDPSLRVRRVPDTPLAREALQRALGVEVAGDSAGPDASDGWPAPAADLLRRFEEEMRLRGYSPRTRKVYLGHARRFLVVPHPTRRRAAALLLSRAR